MVQIRCICPGDKHPDGDTVTLHERLGFRTVLAVRNAVLLLKNEDPDASPADILATLSEAYLLHGIASWTVRDAKGKPVPVSRVAIQEFLLTDIDAAVTVADAADELYLEKVMLPLFNRASTSSPPTPTGSSTLARNGHSRTPRTPSKRSSISTIPMAATGTTTTSPDGDSSSSPN